MNVLDLFSGIGGFSLGLERAGMQTVAFCEIDPYCRAVLRKHWPNVPVYEDVQTLTAERLAADGVWVDAIAAGFPCQDISSAGKRAGITGERSGLWREVVRTLRMVRPQFLLLENVADLLRRGVGTVLGDLAENGFDAEWDCIPAAYIGAPHGRDRFWSVAYPFGREWREEPYLREIGRMGRPHQSVPWDRDWEVALREFRGMDDGSSYGSHRVDAIRNAVVPQIPEIIGRAIMRAEGLAA